MAPNTPPPTTNTASATSTASIPLENVRWGGGGEGGGVGGVTSKPKKGVTGPPPHSTRGVEPGHSILSAWLSSDIASGDECGVDNGVACPGGVMIVGGTADTAACSVAACSPTLRRISAGGNPDHICGVRGEADDEALSARNSVGISAES